MMTRVSSFLGPDVPGVTRRTCRTRSMLSRMARGWESKNVEAQQDERDRTETERPEVTPEEAARLARRRTLELTRARALADLGAARSAQHREMLEAAVRALDEQLRGALDDRKY